MKNRNFTRNRTRSFCQKMKNLYFLNKISSLIFSNMNLKHKKIKPQIFILHKNHFRNFWLNFNIIGEFPKKWEEIKFLSKKIRKRGNLYFSRNTFTILLFRLDVGQKFQFSTKIWIFDQYFNFSSKFHFFIKISLFHQNFTFFTNISIFTKIWIFSNCEKLA